jgi:hypothetical protein
VIRLLPKTHKHTPITEESKHGIHLVSTVVGIAPSSHAISLVRGTTGSSAEFFSGGSISHTPFAHTSTSHDGYYLVNRTGGKIAADIHFLEYE